MITENGRSPQRRLRQPLNVTVVGDFGLTDGVAVWLCEDTLDFLLRERLNSAQPQLVRLDLGGFGSNVDLQVRLLDVTDGRQTPFKKGWLHSGRWSAVSPRDVDLMEDFLGRELSQVSQVSRVGSGVRASSDHTRPTMTTLAGGRLDRSGSSRWSESQVGGREGIRQSMRRATERIAQDRRSDVPETERHARRIVPSRDLVRPVVSMVGGLSLMARYDHAETLERALRVRGDRMRLVLQRAGPVEVGQVVQLVLQLPDGSFLQLHATVRRLGPSRMQLEGRYLSPTDVAILRRCQGS